MKFFTLSFLLVFVMGVQTGFSQAYPPDPEPGACYVRCPKEFRKVNVRQEIVPSYKEFKVIPAVYKTVEEKIEIKPASKRFEYVPAVYREVTDTILVEEPINKITLVPVKTVDTVAVIEIYPAYSQFERRPAFPGCKEKIPGDCDVLCYVVHEAVTKEIPVKKIVANPQHVRTVQQGKFKTIRKKEVVKPATVREIEIPAEYVTVQKRVLVKDETLDSTSVAAVYSEEVVDVRDESEANAETKDEWVKIDCRYLDWNVLPIYYDFNSDLLDAQAKKIIDDKLLQLMIQQPKIRVEVNSHTDSRASDSFNLDLSERRAKAVVDYLVANGIRRSRLVYKGLGETQPVNQCKNGVECTEEEHAKNRRTEFRVLPK